MSDSCATALGRIWMSAAAGSDAGGESEDLGVKRCGVGVVGGVAVSEQVGEFVGVLGEVVVLAADDPPVGAPFDVVVGGGVDRAPGGFPVAFDVPRQVEALVQHDRALPRVEQGSAVVGVAAGAG